MNKTTQGCFFVLVCIVVTLTGCSRTQGDDSSPQAVFPFDESITVGDPQGNPADPFRVQEYDCKYRFNIKVRFSRDSRHIMVRNYEPN